MSRVDDYVTVIRSRKTGIVILDMDDMVRVKFRRGELTLRNGAFRPAAEDEKAKAQAAGLMPEARKAAK